MFNTKPYKVSDDLRRSKIITKKQLREIERRQLYALKANNFSDIMDGKQKVIKIIDEDGLNNDDQKIRLESAFKTLPYIIPQKKAIETTVIHKTIEDIIKEDIPEADYQELDNTADNEDKVQKQAKNEENSVR